MSNAVIWQELRENPLRVASWLALARGYAQHELPWHLGYVQLQVQRLPLASPQDEKSREGVAGLRCASPGRWPGSEVLSMPGTAQFAPEKVCDGLQAHLAVHPTDWLSLLYLARCLELRDAGPEDVQAARARQHGVVRRAMDSEVIAGETGHLLAMWRLRSGEVAGALAALQAVLSQAPGRHGSWLLQAEAQMLAGNVPGGQQAFVQAGRSKNPRLLELLADKLLAFNFPREALSVCKAVVDLEPGNTAARGHWDRIQRALLQGSPSFPSLQ